MRFTHRHAVLAAVLLVVPATSMIALGESSTKEKGATIVTWDSSFQDLDYTLGDTITMVVHWTVVAGAAEYDSFHLKRFTPRSKKDPAKGQMLTVTHDGSDTYVTVTFKFTDLHYDKWRKVDLGNAHFKLYLMVDKDGDGLVESRSGFGVNYHVEDPL